MEKRRIRLNNNIRSVLLQERRMANRSSEDVSKSIGLSSSAVANIENGSVKSVDSTKLSMIIAELRKISIKEAEDYIESNILILGGYDFDNMEGAINIGTEKTEVMSIVQKINKYKTDYMNIKYSYLKEEYKNQVLNKLAEQFEEYKGQLIDWATKLKIFEE